MSIRIPTWPAHNLSWNTWLDWVTVPSSKRLIDWLDIPRWPAWSWVNNSFYWEGVKWPNWSDEVKIIKSPILPATISTAEKSIQIIQNLYVWILKEHPTTDRGHKTIQIHLKKFETILERTIVDGDFRRKLEDEMKIYADFKIINPPKIGWWWL